MQPPPTCHPPPLPGLQPPLCPSSSSYSIGSASRGMWAAVLPSPTTFFALPPVSRPGTGCTWPSICRGPCRIAAGVVLGRIPCKSCSRTALSPLRAPCVPGSLGKHHDLTSEVSRTQGTLPFLLGPKRKPYMEELLQSTSGLGGGCSVLAA